MLGIVALFVVDPVLSGIHHLHEGHFWCSEHGTVEHLRGDELTLGEEFPWNSAVEQDDSPLSFPAEHIECLHQDLLSERFQVEPDHVIAAISPPEAHETDRPALRRPFTVDSPLTYAPKLSPPA